MPTRSIPCATRSLLLKARPLGWALVTGLIVTLFSTWFTTGTISLTLPALRGWPSTTWSLSTPMRCTGVTSVGSRLGSPTSPGSTNACSCHGGRRHALRSRREPWRLPGPTRRRIRLRRRAGGTCSAVPMPRCGISTRILRHSSLPARRCGSTRSGRDLCRIRHKPRPEGGMARIPPRSGGVRCCEWSVPE